MTTPTIHVMMAQVVQQQIVLAHAAQVLKQIQNLMVNENLLCYNKLSYYCSLLCMLAPKEERELQRQSVSINESVDEEWIIVDVIYDQLQEDGKTPYQLFALIMKHYIVQNPRDVAMSDLQVASLQPKPAASAVCMNV